ncbi:MAG: GntR family transcriptional regulator [Agrococcus sp.]
MNAGVTSERVYDALKARLLGGGVLPGERLEPKKLASLLASSVTPVRDALHRLAGEQIVEMRAAEGFQYPLVTEPGLRDLLGWNHALLRLAVRRWPAGTPAPHETVPDGNDADSARALFGAIAARSGSAELMRQVEAASDRLAAARVAEHRVMPGIADELADLWTAIAGGEARPVARRVAAYHRRRLSRIPAIVEAIYRHG